MKILFYFAAVKLSSQNTYLSQNIHSIKFSKMSNNYLQSTNRIYWNDKGHSAIPYAEIIRRTLDSSFATVVKNLPWQKARYINNVIQNFILHLFAEARRSNKFIRSLFAIRCVIKPALQRA